MIHRKKRQHNHFCISCDRRGIQTPERNSRHYSERIRLAQDQDAIKRVSLLEPGSPKAEIRHLGRIGV